MASSASVVPHSTSISSIVSIGPPAGAAEAPSPRPGASETPRMVMPSPSTRLADRTVTSSSGNVCRSRLSTRRRTSSPIRCEPSAAATTTAATESGSVQRTSVQRVSDSGFTWVTAEGGRRGPPAAAPESTGRRT
ncbi:MAG: hypothetical protein EBX35_11505 [Planctomycetia bacterium]|nr:hypothetical protein [Planctomycetia bacterium]